MTPVVFDTQKDYNTFIKVYIIHHFAKWPVRFLYVLYAFAFIFAIIYHEYLTAGFALLVAIGFTSLMYFRARSIYRSSPATGGVTRWQLDDAGITTVSGDFVQQVGWNNIYKVSNTRKWVFIWYNKLLFTFFPRNVLSDEQLAEIKQFPVAKRLK